MLYAHREELRLKLRGAGQKRTRFQKQRRGIRLKGDGVNRAHVLIDQALEDIGALIGNLEETLEVNAAATRMLDAYETVEEPGA